MPLSLPPESLPGLLPLLNFLSVDFRSEELFLLFPNAAAISLSQSYWSLLWAGICADQLWLSGSQGAHRLVGKEMAWMGQMLTSLYTGL